MKSCPYILWKRFPGFQFTGWINIKQCTPKCLLSSAYNLRVVTFSTLRTKPGYFLFTCYITVKTTVIWANQVSVSWERCHDLCAVQKRKLWENTVVFTLVSTRQWYHVIFQFNTHTHIYIYLNVCVCVCGFGKEVSILLVLLHQSAGTRAVWSQNQ